MYKKRLYRNLQAREHLVAFSVAVKETDLFVHAERPLEEITKELIMKRVNLPWLRWLALCLVLVAGCTDSEGEAPATAVPVSTARCMRLVYRWLMAKPRRSATSRKVNPS